MNLNKKVLLFSAFILIGLGISCTSNRVPSVAPTNSTSASEVVAAIISGTVNVTSVTGTQAKHKPSRLEKVLADIKNGLTLLPQAYADIASAGTCPTPQGGGTNCSVSGPTMSLGYATCNFSATPLGALWQGSMTLTSTNAASPVTWACGVTPTYAAGNTVVRTFGSPTDRILLSVPQNSTAGVPTLATIIDTSGSTYGTNPQIINSGITINFSGAVARSIIINGIHIGANAGNYNVWDYELYTNASGLTVDTSNRVANGVVNVIDMKRTATSGSQTGSRTATSTVTAPLIYSAGCCMPTGGTIQTAWIDGTTETLSFTGTCNAAQLNGNNITLTQCL